MNLTVLPAVHPPSIGSSFNGYISADVLVNVGGPSIRLLAIEAATQFNAMRDACLVDTGVFFAILGGGAYRSYADQVALFGQRYTSPPKPGLPATSYRTWGDEKYSLNPGVASAATPGTSNHGWGVAVDVAVPVVDNETGKVTAYTGITGSKAWAWLLEHAIAHGWSWELQDEPWHLRLVELPNDHVPTAAPIVKGRHHMSHCKDAQTGKFWYFGRDSTGAAYACPIDELAGKGDWDVYGPIEDAVNGPLVSAPHAVLQAMYDKRGEPGLAATGPRGPAGPAAPPHHHGVDTQTTDT